MANCSTCAYCGARSDVDEVTRHVDLLNLFQLLCPRVKALNVGCRSGARIALGMGMDYEKMKALLKASREESAVQRHAEVKEFPKPESRLDWKYLDAVAKERMAA